MPVHIYARDDASTILHTIESATLVRADLQGANLRGAHLQGANLQGAHLQGANLRGAHLQGADLQGANLQGANLQGANLQGANLQGAALQDAALQGANLRGAHLQGAAFQGAALQGAKNFDPLYVARLSIVPETGAFVGVKQCRDGVLVTLKIPAKAHRSNATGRKCRASAAKVLRVEGADYGVSLYDSSTIYRVGEVVRCDQWEPDRWIECGGGIHFYLTRAEAEAHT